MKKLITPTVFILIVLFTLPSYAKWKQVGENKKGTIYYVDFERVSKRGGYVFWWELGDRLESNTNGYLSNKAYKQGDCKLLRYKYLSHTYHIEKMGGGNGETVTPKNSNWFYPSPNSSIEYLLKSVCSR